MKKVTTLFALAAIAGGSALAVVESDNIVGFQDAQFSTFQLVTPSFTQVGGGTAFTLADLVPDTAWDPASDKITFYTGAAFDYEATYLEQAIVDDIGDNFDNLKGLSAGWYDYADFADLGNTDPAVLKCYNTRPIPAGTGFAVKCGVAINVPGHDAN
jgi:hypothetical protein